MLPLEPSVDEVAASTGFSGVVRVERRGQVLVDRAYGFAHRGLSVPNAVGTRFGLASATKAFTALTLASLVEDGLLDMSTPARSLLRDDLPLVDDAVTVEHLLAHRSGIGDYFDEDVVTSMTDYVMPVPVHRLATTSDYLAVLDGHPQVFAPGERFGYNNSGYVVLALLAERVGGAPFAELVHERVCRPAALADTAFLRSDEPDGRTATGYLSGDGHRTNVLHLPVVGSGDGGLCSTAADLHALWSAMHAGRIVPLERVAELVRARSDVPSESARYGMGFWRRAEGEAVVVEGADAGVSVLSVHEPDTGLTWTVLSNTTEGAWPVARHLRERLGE